MLLLLKAGFVGGPGRRCHVSPDLKSQKREVSMLWREQVERQVQRLSPEAMGLDYTGPVVQ